MTNILVYVFIGGVEHPFKSAQLVEDTINTEICFAFWSRA